MGSIHVGDAGTIIKFLIVDTDNNIINISTLVSNNVIIQSPSGELNIESGTLYTDGTDGILQYVNTGIFGEPGIWLIQAWVQLSGSKSYHTAITSIRVEKNLI